MVKRTKKKTKKPESSLKPRKIKVIGIGGGGASIVSEMAKGLWNKGIFLVFSVFPRREGLYAYRETFLSVAVCQPPQNSVPTFRTKFYYLSSPSHG